MKKTLFIVIGIILLFIAIYEIHYGRKLKLEEKRITNLREELRRDTKGYKYYEIEIGNQAYQFMREGQYDRAIVWLNFMIDIYDDSYKVMLGEAYLSKNEPRLALNAYASLLKPNVNVRNQDGSIFDYRKTRVLTGMATAYAMLGEHEQAVKLYCERLLYLETSDEFREDYMPGDFDPPPKHIKSPKELSAYLSEHGSKYEKKETLERVLRFLASMPDRLEIKE